MRGFAIPLGPSAEITTILDLGNRRLGLVVADIAGKGIGAAVLMANLQAALRSQCATAWEQPERFLQSVNRLLHENTGDGDYATLFFAEYDDETRKLRYSNCGIRLRCSCGAMRGWNGSA